MDRSFSSTKDASSSSSFNRRRTLKGAPKIPEDIPQNDDEAERKERKRESGKFGQLAGKRVSLGGIAEISASELIAQYTNCMRLSAENKINHKNAFSLPLIDCMKMLLKKKDEQMNNFQVVGCTLDASAKIYASRVDRVHMDGMTFAKGLGGRSRDLPAARNGESEDEGAEDENPLKRRKLKKRRKISRDTSKIDISLDAAEPDSTYVALSKDFSNCQPSFISFIPRLKMVGDSKVLVDMKRQFLSKEEETTGYEEADVPFDFVDDGDYEILASPLREIIARDSGDIDSDLLLHTSCLDDTLGFDTMDNHLDNDMDDVCAALEEDAPLNGEGVLTIEGPSTLKNISVRSTDRDLLMNEVRAGCLARTGQPERVVDLQKAILKEVKEGSNLEYSYMNLDRILFAGPTHWGPLPKLKGKEGNMSAAEGVKRKEKKIVNMDFTNVQETTISSGNCKLTRKYIESKWNTDDVTNPIDLHLDPKRLLRFFSRPRCGFSLSTSQEKPAIPPEEEDDDACDYDYDNLNDSQQFCPALDLKDGYEADVLNSNTSCVNNVEPPTDVHSCASSQVGDAWSMVDPPNKVARIAVPFAQHAKKVDMKVLKAAIWRVLTDDSKQNLENISGLTPKQRKNANAIRNKNSHINGMTRKMNFSEMERKVMAIVPADMAQELTMPLTFTALLHLANERVLTLTCCDDHSDLIIAQDSGAESFVRRLQEREYV